MLRHGSYAGLRGAAAPSKARRNSARVFNAHGGADALVELLTMVLGPESLLVAARFDIADELDSREVEALAEELDEQLRAVVPDVDQVFLDPTRRRVASR